VIPVSYWLTASDESLGNVALNRRNQAANVRKDIKAMEKEIRAMELEAENLEIEAGIALWLCENRKDILQKTGKHLERIEDARKRENVA
jgi:hypothetical protein